MSPTVTILPASTNAGKATIRALLASPQPPTINAIYRDTAKAPAEFLSHPSFTATQGDVSDASTLDFTDTNLLFYIPPPTYSGTDQGEWATRTANNVRIALEKSAPSSKRLVLFSSLGAQHDRDIGILRLNHITDEILKGTVGDVVVVRPGYFQEGFASMVQGAVESESGVIRSWITPVEYRVPLVGLRDIASTCAEELLKPVVNDQISPRYIKVFGPRHYSSLDLQSAMSEVIGKDVKLEAVERDQLAEYFAQVVPPAYVQEFVDMTTAVLPGGIMAGDFGWDDDKEDTTTVRGTVGLVDTLREVYAGMKE